MTVRTLLTIAQARERVLAHVVPLESERAEVEEALGRVLAAPVVASGDVPPFDCSAMDGYAIEAGPAGRRLKLVGEARAGAPSGLTLGPGEAIRISTGAAVPAGAGTVIRQEEDTEALEDEIETTVEVRDGQHIRRAGEDLRGGTTVLEPGTRLGTAELGIAVGAGVGELMVARQPHVAVICTGDELRGPGEALQPGQIHNSNAIMLTTLSTRAGALVEAAARLRDDPASTEAAFAAALADADVLVVSGGVSVGPHDHVRPALSALGVQERFWGVAMQPGKPMWFGTRDRQLVFGLPGNPVSAVVTFALFAWPALAALQGAAGSPAQPAEAELGEAVMRNPGREQALRVRLEQREGRTVAIPNGGQESHLVSSLLGAAALALIPAGEGELELGATVALAPLPN